MDSTCALAAAVATSAAAQAPVGYGDEQRHKLLAASSYRSAGKTTSSTPVGTSRSATSSTPRASTPRALRPWPWAMRESHPSCPAAPRWGSVGGRARRRLCPYRCSRLRRRETTMRTPHEVRRGEEDEQGGGASSCPWRTVFAGGVGELHLSITVERSSIFTSPFGSSIW
jgi:hypothetical protein